jgi:hypothetical protein
MSKIPHSIGISIYILAERERKRIAEVGRKLKSGESVNNSSSNLVCNN